MKTRQPVVPQEQILFHLLSHIYILWFNLKRHLYISSNAKARVDRGHAVRQRKDKTRNRLKDKTMSAILHVHDTAIPDPQSCLPQSIKLKVSVSRSLADQLRMEKRVGDRVCDVFLGKRYHGEVTRIIFHDVYAQYMYHVVFEDGDEQDYWRHELEMIRCQCVVDDCESSDST